MEAVGDLSALVNYIEPMRFHSFEHAESTSCHRVCLYRPAVHTVDDD